MNENHIIQKVDNNRWKQAQEFELKFARMTIESDDDWNQWWTEKFDGYSICEKICENKNFNNLIQIN